MGIFHYTSDNYQLKIAAILCLLLPSLWPLHAGTVVSLDDFQENEGKASMLDQNTLRLDTNSTVAKYNLSRILEADFHESTFGDSEYPLDCFFSNSSNALPSSWVGQDIGHVDVPGSFSFNGGDFVLAGNGPLQTGTDDQLYFVGRPWKGDGQWTIHIKDVDEKTPGTEVGLSVRDSFEAESLHLDLGTTKDGGGVVRARRDAGKKAGEVGFSWGANEWLRLTRSGQNISASVSTDGKQWDVVDQRDFHSADIPWIGIYVISHKDKVAGKAVVDQVSFTPASAIRDSIPPGTLLRNGSLISGFPSFTIPASGTDGVVGRLDWPKNGSIPISIDQLASALWYPTLKSVLTDVGAQGGAILKNGDVLSGNLQKINGYEVVINSVLSGIRSCNSKDVVAYVYQQVVPQPSNYEVRLLDGSILYAKDFAFDKIHWIINDNSGLSVSFTPDEIAQIFAGSIRAQALINSDWKISSPVTGSSPALSNPQVPCWIGPWHDQVMVLPAGVSVEFPIKGKAQALALRITVSPDSPPGATMVLRVLANNKEIYKTPSVASGERPRFVETEITDAQNLTLVADTSVAGAKILIIDPLVIH